MVYGDPDPYQSLQRDPSRPGEAYDDLVGQWVPDPYYTPDPQPLVIERQPGFLRRHRVAAAITGFVMTGIAIAGVQEFSGSSSHVSAHENHQLKPLAAAAQKHYPSIYENGNIPRDPANGDPIIDISVAQSEFPNTPTSVIQQDMKGIVSLSVQSTRINPDLPKSDVCVENGISFGSGGGTGFVVDDPAFGKVLYSAGHIYPTGYDMYNGLNTAFDPSDGSSSLTYSPTTVYTQFTMSPDEQTDNGKPDMSVTPLDPHLDQVPALPVLSTADKDVPFGTLLADISDQPSKTQPLTLRNPGSGDPSMRPPTAVDGINLGPFSQDPRYSVVLEGIGNMTNSTDYNQTTGGASGSPEVSVATGQVDGILDKGLHDLITDVPETIPESVFRQMTNVEVVDNGKPVTTVGFSLVERLPSDSRSYVGTSPVPIRNLSASTVTCG